ncbi:TonB-dependent siderophore receptor [Acinetobacter puyangensis]|uniref:Iron complex outermembrane recepter protein n=1 Tax=Acinetobacter puyangensis TaxID=1096779 RepID=A0A240ED39_9GAMM|nr:TonB-dependent receptor [Acinetobacter puyangensis]SNX46614.1 iron complex outermembrane recepter protein [Acinetobacter puyangensis]
MMKKPNPCKNFILKPVVLSIHLAFASSFVFATSSATAGSTENIQQYAIAAGDLSQALNQFAVQSGVAISTEGKALTGLTTKGLYGNYRVEQGLTILLQGTPFTAQPTQVGYILIGKNDNDKVQARDMGQLNPIDVTARGTANGNVTQLPVITVNAEITDASADQGYVAKKLKQVGPWGEKSLQDTPYSMSVMSSELIENTVSGDLDQMFKMNPVTQSSALTTVWGYPVANIRGFSTSAGIVDGMRLSSYTYGLSTEEIDRVEIMNGLTGFMYGAGNVGGTTNYIIKRPTQEKLANLTLGNYGNQQWFGHIDLGNKIDEEGRWAYRFNAAYQNGETSKDDQNVEKRLVSGALDWQATDELLLQVQAAHKFWRVDRPDNRFYAQGIDYWPKAYDNSKTFSPSWTYNQTESDRAGINATWQINDIFSLRSAYLYKKDTREFVIIYPIFTPNGWTMYKPGKTTPYDTISQGVYSYLDAKFNTGTIQHKLTVGFSGDNYQEKKYTNSYVQDIDSAYVTPSRLTADQLMSLNSPNFSTNYGTRYKATDNTNKNIIIGDEVIFNDQWSALLGINYTKLNVKSYSTSGAVASGYKDSAVTPTFSLIFKPFEQLTTYASYMEGLEQGSSVPTTKNENDEYLYNDPGKIFDPYISKQYELGAKYAFADNLLLSSALFRIEKANSYEEAASNGKLTLNQDGLQIHQGIELTLTGKVTDNLTVMTGGTLMDLSVDKATNANLKGKKPVGAASTLAKIYAEYNLPFIEGLSLTGGVYYTGSKYKNNTNTQKVDGYTLLDAGVRYKTQIGQYPTTLNLNATNLTNKNYWSSEWQLGAPRNIAFSVKTQF